MTMMKEPYIDIREEMEWIKTRQMELIADENNHREWWKLQIVWEYLRDRIISQTIRLH